MAEGEERMMWKGRFEFLFTTFGYLIGLGNVWRFPEKCYRHGGGAFLFPYLLTVVFCTIPMLFMEMCLGQFSSEGPIRVWKISPAFVGVGWAIMFVIFVTTIYYITPIMFALYYMLVSFVNIGGTLPWDQCRPNDEWSTKECIAGNTSAEEEYWNRFVLGEHESEGVHDLGGVVLRNACLLLVMWIIVYYCCLRGIRSIAKVIYVTATFPFGIIIILLVRGLTLKGHSDGIAYYLKPDWSKLSDMNIWSSAANQAIYSLGIAYGSHIALASHNQFRNNIFRDAIIIGVTNTLTSFLLGLVVFSFLGHGSHKLNIPVEDMIDHGPGVLFISYIQGITQLPGSPIWAVLFFLMVFTLGLDSQFVMVWTMVSCIQDSFPKIAKKYRRLVLAGVCLLMFLLGLPLATKGGIHMIVLMDRYVADIGLATLMLCEAVSVCWLYGLNNFIRDVEMMIGHKSRHFWWFWKLTWMFTVPLFSVFIFIASCVSYQPSSYRGKEIGAGGEAIGWLIILTPLVIVAACVALQVRRYHGVKAAIFNSDKWRPRRAVDRFDRYANNNFRLDTPALKQASDKLDENDAGFQNGEHVYNISGEVPTHETDCDASEDRLHHSQFHGLEPNEAFAEHVLVQHDTDSAIQEQKQKRVSDTRIFDSYEGWESDDTVGPPVPHRPVPYAEEGDRQSSSDNNDVFLTDNHLPGHGYITAISKRPAPSIPQPTRCDSKNRNEPEGENSDV